MEKKLENKISYYESPVYKIAETLKNKGYIIANSSGIRISETPKYVFGILKPRESIEKKFLGFKWKEEPKALYIGNLWVDNDLKKASPDKRWVLEVYGRNNIQELTELVRELSEPRKVDIHIELKSEEPEFEYYKWEF